MGNDDKKTCRVFNRDQTNVSWFKIGGTNYRSPVHRRVKCEFFGKFQKASMTTRRWFCVSYPIHSPTLIYLTIQKAHTFGSCPEYAPDFGSVYTPWVVQTHCLVIPAGGDHRTVGGVAGTAHLRGGGHSSEIFLQIHL